MNRRRFLKLLSFSAASTLVLDGLGKAPFGWAQTSVLDNLNELLEPIRSSYGVPALAGAFIQEKSLVGLGAIGLRRLNNTEPVQTKDLFHLGSNTKSMTATLCATLVETGNLQWETTIADVFPDSLNKIRPDYHKVTLVQLLSHQAGIVRDPGSQAIRQLPNGSSRIQRRALVDVVLANGPINTPGSTYAYSNTGYMIAGAMAEQVADKSWETLIQEGLFAPLGMTSAGFGAPGVPGKTDEPWGHSPNGMRPVEPGPQADNPPIYGPAGTVHMSLSDWAKYALVHLRGAQGESNLLLKPESFQALHKDWFNQNYALGWGLAARSWGNGPALWHNGSNSLWYALIWVAPRCNVAILTATNCVGANQEGSKACDACVNAIVRKYL